MKKTNLLIASLILLVLLNIGTLGFIIYAQKRPANEMYSRNEPSEFIIQKLQLDNNQQKEFEILKQQHHMAAEAIQQKDKQLHDAFFDLLKTDNPDKAKVDSIASLVAGQQRQLVLSAFDHFASLRSICTDSQKKLFDENINEIARIVAERRLQQGPPHHPRGMPHP